MKTGQERFPGGEEKGWRAQAPKGRGSFFFLTTVSSPPILYIVYLEASKRIP